MILRSTSVAMAACFGVQEFVQLAKKRIDIERWRKVVRAAGIQAR